MKKIISTENAPKAIGPYSQAIQMGDFVFCSGQVALNPQTGEVFTGDIRIQTEMVMKNVTSVLEAAGLNLSNIVKTTIFLTSMNDFAAVNEAYGKFFTEAPPARSTVAVAGLPRGVNVEIEVIAHR
ncbi:putative translation initiation inhibitor [Bdellovibrio bacteriovorus W]|nr:putative translation initiation inhibitor [Bdellovibrio bacteriovorus W]